VVVEAEATEGDLKMDTTEAQVVEVQTNPVLRTRDMEVLVQQDKVMQEEILDAAAVVKYQAAVEEELEVLDRMVPLVVVVVQHLDPTILVTVETDFKIQFLARLFGTPEEAEAEALVQARIFRVQMASEEDKPLTVVEDNVN
jgi:hypothetical protein